MKRNDPPMTEAFPSVNDDIDASADEFETTWTPGAIDKLETILNAAPESERTNLLMELLYMEFELRFKNGWSVDVANYVARFPQYGTEIESVHAELMRSRRLGAYEYYEVLGKGGMGIVYRARHLMLDRVVAVKSLHGHIIDNADAVERFRREIRLIGKLKHQNIVNAEYADAAGTRYYLVMELVDGQSVHQFVARYGPMPIPIACEVIRQAALGLQYAMEQDIIHRDVKPGNLMIQKPGIVKILDFGLGKFLTLQQPGGDYSLTMIGSTMGSVDYIAPEQCEDAASATVRADIYSLGCTFFFLLTGRAPYEEKHWNRDQRMIAHLKGEIPSLHQFCENIPGEIESCYKKMVARKPNDRFAQPSEIAQKLEPFAAPLTEWMKTLEDDEKNSVKLTPSFAKTAGRSRLSTLAAKIILPTTLLLSAVSGTLWFYNRDSAPPGSVDSCHNIPVSADPEFVQFIGYSGKWWFDDLPWFLPVVREIATEATEVPSAARRASEKYRHEKTNTLTPILVSLLETGVPNEALLVDFESACEISSANASEPAAWIHTRAVFQHYLAERHNDPTCGEKARNLYGIALQGYDREASETSRLLGNLCRFDLARLNFWFNNDSDDFQRAIRLIPVTENDDLAFRAEQIAVPAERQMLYGKNPDVSFRAAIKLLEPAAERLSAMLVELYRRYAVALTRQWRLDEAEPFWAKAIDGLSGDKPSGEELRDAVVECRLALAASARYSGDLKTARKLYRDLIEEIQEELLNLSETEIDTSQPMRRLVESLEGLADCTLFVPTHFGPRRLKNVNFYVEEAEDLYVEARNKTIDPETQFVLRCKLAFLQNTVGNKADAEKTWEIAGKEYAGLSPAADARRAADYFLVGEALFAPNDQKVQHLRILLDNFRMNRNMVERYAGEKLDLHLGCIRHLLESELQNDEIRAAQSDCERYLDPILLQHLVLAWKMRPFLAPFYDLAIRCVQETDFVRTAETIRTMRNQRHSGSIIGAHLVFYFSPTEEKGFAVFLPPGLQDCRRFDLDYCRQDIFEAVKNGQPFSLPEELTTCIEQARRSAVRVELSWNDSACWAREEDSLSLDSENRIRRQLFGVVK